MKYFVLSLLFTFAFSSSVLSLDEKVDSERLIVLTLEKIDGSIVTKTFSLEEFQNLQISKFEEGVFSCTVGFSNGECTVTASTCEAARAGFEACACAMNHAFFC